MIIGRTRRHPYRACILLKIYIRNVETTPQVRIKYGKNNFKMAHNVQYLKNNRVEIPLVIYAGKKAYAVRGAFEYMAYSVCM
jgi:hypothetical protein